MVLSSLLVSSQGSREMPAQRPGSASATDRENSSPGATLGVSPPPCAPKMISQCHLDVLQPETQQASRPWGRADLGIMSCPAPRRPLQCFPNDARLESPSGHLSHCLEAGSPCHLRKPTALTTLVPPLPKWPCLLSNSKEDPALRIPGHRKVRS